MNVINFVKKKKNKIDYLMLEIKSFYPLTVAQNIIDISVRSRGGVLKNDYQTKNKKNN
jgi:hypothetical protein